MESIKDFWTSVAAHLYERVSSPFLSSYFIFWSLLNHEFYIIVLSGTPVTKKLALLEQQVFPTDYCYALFLSNNFILPIVFSLIYIYLFPKVNIEIYKVWKRYKNEQVAEKHKLDGEVLLTKEQSDALRIKMFDLRQQHTEDLARRDQENSALLNKLKDANLQRAGDSIANARRDMDDSNPDESSSWSRAITPKNWSFDGKHQFAHEDLISDIFRDLYENGGEYDYSKFSGKERSEYHIAINKLSRAGFIRVRGDILKIKWTPEGAEFAQEVARGDYDAPPPKK